MIRKILREFYMLPRGEQRAMLLLSLLLILSLAFRVTIQMLPAREPPAMEQFIMESRTIMAELAGADSLNQVSQRNYSKPSVSPELAFSRLGSARQGSSANQSPSKSFPASRNHSPSYISPVNINTVDSAGLLLLPGIGPVFAGRIVRYRNLLGGYVSTDQLLEVYGLSPETIEFITPMLYTDTTDLIQIRVNTAGFRDLLRHPYLEYEGVKALVKYRDMEGSIRSLNEIIEHNLLTDTTLERIHPYLDFVH
jgi:competence protein ComEA